MVYVVEYSLVFAQSHTLLLCRPLPFPTHDHRFALSSAQGRLRRRFRRGQDRSAFDCAFRVGYRIHDNSRLHSESCQKTFNVAIGIVTVVYRIASGGVALPNDWKLLFGGTIPTRFVPAKLRSQEGTCCLECGTLDD
jgi:hypothetical protein